jgi:hypothetical protein
MATVLTYMCGTPMFNTKTLSQFSGSTCLCPFTRLDLHNVTALDVRKSVHHHTIQIIQPTRCKSFTSLLLDVYVWLNMFQASPRPSSGAYNYTRSLWFYRCKETAGALLVVVWHRTASPTTTNSTDTTMFLR